MKRRTFLTWLGTAAAGVAGDAFGVQPAQLDVSRHRLGTTGPAIRVAQITDLHLQHLNNHARRIARALNREQPHIVIISGDAIDKKDRLPELQRFLELLHPDSVKFATLGNWEHWSMVDVDKLGALYGKYGCRLLVNESAIVRHGDKDVVITGLDDWTAGHPDFAAAVKGIAPHPNHLLIAHSPMQRDALPAVSKQYSIAAILAGHTHGGQVAFFGWAPVLPAGSGHYVRGWFRKDGVPMYVSRGLGTSLLHVRFGSKPELPIFDWNLT